MPAAGVLTSHCPKAPGYRFNPNEGQMGNVAFGSVNPITFRDGDAAGLNATR